MKIPWRILGPLLLLVALTFTASVLVWQADPTHEEQDIIQERLDSALPPLSGEYACSQTFVSTRDGLYAIELLLVVYDQDRALPPDAALTLSLEPMVASASGAVTSTLSAIGLEHNQRVRFSFPRQFSQGVPYRLTLSANDDHGMSFWATDRDAYASGALYEQGQERPGDLYFVTCYEYDLAQVLRDALRLCLSGVRHLAGILALLLVPGLALWAWLWFRPRGLPGTAGAIILTLSLATWPLVLLWTSVVGLHLTPGLVWTIVAGWALLAAAGLWRQRGALNAAWRAQREWLADIALVLILLLAFGTRALHVRDLLVPAWVDSVHHTLITKIIMERGILPMSLQPYAQIDTFHYHYGFHASAAALGWLTGLGPPQAVLLLGQLLNALAAVSVYGLTVAWSRHRWAGVGAALVVTTLAYMPAYYVSWGRYTQLAGLVLLPGVCLATTRFWQRPKSARSLVVAGICATGLALTHYRVLVFYILFWIAYAVVVMIRRSVRKGWQTWLQCGLWLALVCLLLLAPWALRFVRGVLPTLNQNYGGLAASEGLDTTFPIGLMAVGWTRVLLYLACAGAVWALLRHRFELALVPVWCGLCLLMANLHWLGLHDIWLIHNSSVAISFWLPVALLCGWLVADVSHCMVCVIERLWPAVRLNGVLRLTRTWLLLAVVLMLGGWRAWQMVDVVNPVTRLVTRDDLVAINWVRDNLAEDALILINTRRWQGELRVGGDAGWWIQILGDRKVTLPCVLYGQGDPLYVNAINDLARSVEDAESLGDPELVRILTEAGVSHVFVGSRGGRLMPKELDADAHYALLFTHGPSRVYAFVPKPD